MFVGCGVELGRTPAQILFASRSREFAPPDFSRPHGYNYATERSHRPGAAIDRKQEPSVLALDTADTQKETWPSPHRKRARAGRARQAGATLYRRLTAPARLLPDFIIIGGQRCGTTSLYRYLIRHPGVVPALKKEVHFFDNNFGKGIHWYRAHFPWALQRAYARQALHRDMITGEASPYYIFHPLAPHRIAATIPHVRLIALLRNPIDRAYSHYQKEVWKGRESLSFEEAIEQEPKRLRGEREKIIENGDYQSIIYRRFSYLSRGVYADQIEAWQDLFPREQILMLKSEDLYRDPSATLHRVLAFLRLPDLPGWQPEGYRQYNRHAYPEMEGATRKRLAEYFAPHNRRLYELLGADFGWER
ncbi:MAG: sulfotransferase domain-containing protein [Armatimonadetes bacterium]|nr:sulfotransferase domain-containing protein [Armatimonadota bacterium]